MEKKSLLKAPFEYLKRAEANFSGFEIIHKNNNGRNNVAIKNRNGLLPTPPPLEDSNVSQLGIFLESSKNKIYAEPKKNNFQNDDNFRDFHTNKKSSTGLLPFPDEPVSREIFSNVQANKSVSNTSLSLEKRSRFSDVVPTSATINNFESVKRKNDFTDSNFQEKQVKKSRFKDSLNVDTLSSKNNDTNFEQALTYKSNSNELCDSSKDKMELNKERYKVLNMDSFKSNDIYKLNGETLNESIDGNNYKYKLGEHYFLKSSSDEYGINSRNMRNHSSEEIFKPRFKDIKENESFSKGRIRFHAPHNNKNIKMESEKSDLMDDKKNLNNSYTSVYQSNSFEKFDANNKSPKKPILDHFLTRCNSSLFMLESNANSQTFNKDFIPGICEDIKEQQAEISELADDKVGREFVDIKLQENKKIRLFELFKKCQERAYNKISTADSIEKDAVSKISNQLINNYSENINMTKTEIKEKYDNWISGVSTDDMEMDSLNSLSLNEIIILYNETIENIFKPDSGIKISEKDMQIMKTIQNSLKESNIPIKDIDHDFNNIKDTKLVNDINKKSGRFSFHDDNDKSPFLKDLQKYNNCHDNDRTNNYSRSGQRERKNKFNRDSNLKYKNKNFTHDRKDVNERNQRHSGNGLLENPYVNNNLTNPFGIVNPLNAMLVDNQANILQSNLALQLLAANLQNNLFNTNITTKFMRKL